jgi:hypothetical protein
MKKVLISLGIVGILLFGACDGKKTENGNGEGTDSVETNAPTKTSEMIPAGDTEMEADGVETAPAEEWTEEAVAKQIKKVYAEVSKAYAPSADGMENNTDLDAMFCTKDFNLLQQQIRAINAKKSSERRFEREDLRWTYGMDVPVTPKNIKVELLTGNTAVASFELSSGEQWMYTKLTLDWEDGQWKIRSWSEVGDDTSDLIDEMFEYVEANSKH